MNNDHSASRRIATAPRLTTNSLHVEAVQPILRQTVTAIRWAVIGAR